MSSHASVLKPAMIIMLGRVLGYAACFAIPIVLVRQFDQETFGTYKQLFLVFGTLFGLAQLGMAESLFYFVPERARRAGRYVFNAMVVLAVAGALCAAGLWIFREPVAQLMNNPQLVETLPYIGWYLLFMLMASVLEIVMTARKRHRAASATYAVSDVLRASLSIVPVLYFQDLRWLMGWAVAFAAARFLAAAVYVTREFGDDFRPRRMLAARQAAYAGPFSVAVLIEMMQSQFHLYFVSYHFDAATFAIYAIACLQIPLVEFLTSSVGNVLMVRMRELAKVSTAAVLSVWRDTVAKLGRIMFPMVGVLLVTAHDFITTLFTAEYAASVPIFMVWCLSILFAALPADCGLRVYAQNRYLIGLNIVRLVVVVTLVSPLLDRFGLIGPAAATLLALAVFKILAVKRIATLLDTTLAHALPWASLGRTLAISALAAVPPLLVQAGTDWSPPVSVVVSVALYGAIYAPLLLAYGGLSALECHDLIGWIARPLRLKGEAPCAE
ncbi:MAG: oligosaccharide flippase family protein [Gammaproteobacteria bacterium]